MGVGGAASSESELKTVTTTTTITKQVECAPAAYCARTQRDTGPSTCNKLLENICMQAFSKDGSKNRNRANDIHGIQQMASKVSNIKHAFQRKWRGWAAWHIRWVVRLPFWKCRSRYL